MILRTSKVSGIILMKKMLLTLGAGSVITGCSTDVYCSKQTGSSSTKGNHHPSFLRFRNWHTVCRWCQNLWRRRKNVVKIEPRNIRKWIARFYYFRYLYSAGSACIAHNTARASTIWATRICTAH